MIILGVVLVFGLNYKKNVFILLVIYLVNNIIWNCWYLVLLLRVFWDFLDIICEVKLELNWFVFVWLYSSELVKISMCMFFCGDILKLIKKILVVGI